MAAQPGIEFVRECIDCVPFIPGDAVDGKAAFFFPPAGGAHILAQERRNRFPGVEPLFWGAGHSGFPLKFADLPGSKERMSAHER